MKMGVISLCFTLFSLEYCSCNILVWNIFFGFGGYIVGFGQIERYVGEGESNDKKTSHYAI